MKRWIATGLGAGLALFAAMPALAADRIPRTAVISAFEPEWIALKASVARPRERSVNGVRFVTGTIGGKPVLLFLSGMSMVNAAMTTQLALDRYRVARIVFSGIAGGIDPALAVGDVVAPDRWAEYIESTFARAEGDGFAPPPDGHDIIAGMGNYGMIFPRAVEVRHAGATAPEQRAWFAADPALLAIARRAVTGVALSRCVDALCLRAQPRVRIGGNGVSGPVFLDNAAFRGYVFATWHAQVVDMESAAVAQTAYANGVPFIAFRSLSDLAGGDPGANQASVFFKLASENSATVVKAFIAALP